MRLFNGSMLAVLLTGAAMSMSLGVNGQITWDGGAKDNKWSSANNWSGNSVPSSSNFVKLDNSNVSSGYTVKLNPSSVNYINKLRISSSVTLEQSGATTSSTFTIEGDLIIDAGSTYDATSASADLKVEGKLDIGGSIDRGSTNTETILTGSSRQVLEISGSIDALDIDNVGNDA